MGRSTGIEPDVKQRRHDRGPATHSGKQNTVMNVKMRRAPADSPRDPPRTFAVRRAATAYGAPPPLHEDVPRRPPGNRPQFQWSPNTSRASPEESGFAAPGEEARQMVGTAKAGQLRKWRAGTAMPNRRRHGVPEDDGCHQRVTMPASRATPRPDSVRSIPGIPPAKRLPMDEAPAAGIHVALVGRSARRQTR